MKSKAYIMGFICGLILVAVLCFITAYIKKRIFGSVAEEYDERQQAIRGVGYKIAYLTAISIAVAGGLLDVIFDLHWVGLFPFAMFILWISICVFATYAILRDAYFTLRSRRGLLTICFLAVGVANLIIGICSIALETGWMTDGKLNVECVNLLTGVCSFYLGCVLIYKHRHDLKLEEEE